MTRRQRSQRYARRVHHQLTQRARLRAALASAPALASNERMEEHMASHGYEPHWRQPGRRRRRWDFYIELWRAL